MRYGGHRLWQRGLLKVQIHWLARTGSYHASSVVIRKFEIIGHIEFWSLIGHSLLVEVYSGITRQLGPYHAQVNTLNFLFPYPPTQGQSLKWSALICFHNINLHLLKKTPPQDVSIVWLMISMNTDDPLHSRALAHSRAPLFTQPCPHCSHSRAPWEQWARLCVFTSQGCVQAARLCRGSPVMKPLTRVNLLWRFCWHQKVLWLHQSCNTSAKLISVWHTLPDVYKWPSTTYTYLVQQYIYWW